MQSTDHSCYRSTKQHNMAMTTAPTETVATIVHIFILLFLESCTLFTCISAIYLGFQIVIWNWPLSPVSSHTLHSWGRSKSAAKSIVLSQTKCSFVCGLSEGKTVTMKRKSFCWILLLGYLHASSVEGNYTTYFQVFFTSDIFYCFVYTIPSCVPILSE